MANDMNQCNFTGRLGQDPEVKFLPSGDPVANLRFCVGKTWKDKNSGQKQEKPNWITLVAFGRTAEIIQQYTKKGDQLRVTCEMQVREWEAQDGGKRSATEFVIREMQMLGSPGGGQQGGQQGQQGGYQQQGQQQGQQQQSMGQQGRNLYQGQQQGGAPQGGQQQGAPDPGSFDDFDDSIPF